MEVRPVAVVIPVGGQVSFQAHAPSIPVGSQLSFQVHSPSASVTTVVWSATGGNISSTGLYTAPATPGSYSIQATVGGVTASATVNVVAAGGPASFHAAASAACAAMPLRTTGVVTYFCDCSAGAQSGCVAGNDANAGTTASAPKRSWSAIASTFNSMAIGGTVALCKGGSWAGSRAVLQNTSCRAAVDPRVALNSMTCDLRDYSPPWGGTNKPLIKSTSGNLLEFSKASDAGVRVLNLELDGSSTGQWAVWLYGKHDDYFFCNNTVRNWGWAFDIQNSSAGAPSRVHVVGNRILNNSGEGYWGGASGGSVDANYFENNGNANPGYDHTAYLAQDNDYSSESINFSFTNNEIRYTSEACNGIMVVVHGQFNGLNIENNIVDGGAASTAGCWGIGAGNGEYPTPGWYKNLTIRRNYVVNAGNMGITCEQCPNSIVENNVVILSNNDYPRGIAVPSHPARTSLGEPITTAAVIRNNTIYFNSAAQHGRGIQIGVDANSDGTINEGSGYVVANNSIYHSNAGHSCFETPVNLFAFIGNNACYNGPWTTTYDSTTRITANPLYANAAADFTPQVGSPLNGAGSGARAPTTDINLKTRPNPPSIGAIER